MKAKENKLLSKRVNFPSVGVILDEYVPQMVTYFGLSDDHAAKFQEAMRTIFHRFLCDATYAARLGAEKGIQEAFGLMEDPEYHEIVRKRRATERQRMKEMFSSEKKEAQEIEFVRRRDNPTRDEKITDLCRAVWDMASERKRYHANQQVIERYVGEEGEQILGDVLKRMTHGLDEDLWLANFDIHSFIRALSAVDIEQPPRKTESSKSLDDLDDFFDRNANLDDEEKP